MESVEDVIVKCNDIYYTLLEADHTCGRIKRDLFREIAAILRASLEPCRCKEENDKPVDQWSGEITYAEPFSSKPLRHWFFCPYCGKRIEEVK